MQTSNHICFLSVQEENTKPNRNVFIFADCREIYKGIVSVLSKSDRKSKMDSSITSLWSELQRENKYVYCRR